MAACDRDGLLAYPVTTVAGGPRAIDELAALVADRQAELVIVGLPTGLAGREGPAAARIRGYAGALAAATDVPVRLLDERLTTVSAARQLREAGRSARRQRAVIDQAAAVAILEHALAAWRQRGAWPGALLSAATVRPATEEESE